MKKLFILALLLIVFTLSAQLDLSTQKEVEHSVQNGLSWLVEQQLDDGSWNHYPAITALTVVSILQSNPSIDADFTPVAKGLKFLESCVKIDGAIHIGDLPNYNTAISLIAFRQADMEKYKSLILDAERYLLGVQLDEKKGFTPDSLFYGGIGYDGSDNRPDMSNLQWVLESLQHKENSNPELNIEDPNKEKKKLFYDKALTFLARCQNLEEYNPESYALNDGGFIYEVGKSKVGNTESYGSMTYAGLKSMIYAQLSKEDPRVTAAYNWLTKNYTVTENPSMGQQGLYYYYQTMAKALRVFGFSTITLPDGTTHNWRNDLATQVIIIQNEEGWWQNSNGRWWENDKVLATCYSLLTLEEILK